MAEGAPTRTEVRRAKKADLQGWCRQFKLDESGTVVELRERLLDHLDELEKEEEAEEVEIEEEVAEEEAYQVKAYQVKAKPTLDPAKVRLLALKTRMQRRRPSFLRQEWFRYPRLGEKWRKPQGQHSKMRRSLRYRGRVPAIGYRGPRKVRGLHPSGFEEVMVHRPDDLNGLDPRTQAARIAHTVGTRKRLAIQEKADELEIRVLNRVVE